MKVEIWSDIACPFCYIGKRRFEKALTQFDQKDEVEVVWRSFQLTPQLVTNAAHMMIDHLMIIKGWSKEQATEAIEYVSSMAEDVGLNFNLNKAIPANTFNAHRLIHFAKTIGKGEEIKEALLKAYFIEAKNIDDTSTLVNLGREIGLTNVDKMLAGSDYSDAVKDDIHKASQLGIRGVPYFYFNSQQGISGAQHSETFLNVLQSENTNTLL